MGVGDPDRVTEGVIDTDAVPDREGVKDGVMEGEALRVLVAVAVRDTVAEAVAEREKEGLPTFQGAGRRKTEAASSQLPQQVCGPKRKQSGQSEHRLVRTSAMLKLFARPLGWAVHTCSRTHPCTTRTVRR